MIVDELRAGDSFVSMDGEKIFTIIRVDKPKTHEVTFTLLDCKTGSVITNKSTHRNSNVDVEVIRGADSSSAGVE